MSFPAGVHADYVAVAFPTNNRAGIFFVGDAVTFTLSKATATGYHVRDFDGDIVSSGSTGGTSLTPAPPSGGWDLGWYRLYLTGPEISGTTAYGSTNFSVWAADSRFAGNQPVGTRVGWGSGGGDVAVRGMVGMGPVRWSIVNADDPDYQAHPDTDYIYATALGAAAESDWYVGDDDPVRPRKLFVSFPGGTASAWSAVGDAVTALYPTITYFEGPRNEPEGTAAATVATEMQAFHTAIKAANAGAQVMGPQIVASINTSATSWLGQFVTAGGADYCDALSIHTYNMMTGGDFAAGHRQFGALRTYLDGAGLGAKPVWVTEAGFFDTVYGVYHPRRMARLWMAQFLLMEQYGIPKERVYPHYDKSHGFWDFPSFWQLGDLSLSPLVSCMRVYSAEVYGKAFTSAVDFGDPGNSLYLGTTLTDPATGDAVTALMAQSAGLGPVTFGITGTETLTLVDHFGRTTSLAVTDGAVSVPVTEVPSYLRLPDGVTATLRQFGSFPVTTISSTNHAYPAWGGVTLSTSGTSTNLSRLANGTVDSGYDADAPWVDQATALPLTLTLSFASPVAVDHVVVWAGFGWQNYATLTDFDVQTLDGDGLTWTTRASYTADPVPSSFAFTANYNGTGCTRETYWDDRSVYDLSFDAVKTSGVRLLVRATSNGGEPDADAIAAGGQGWDQPITCIREVQIFADGLIVHPRMVLANT